MGGSPKPALQNSNFLGSGYFVSRGKIVLIAILPLKAK